MLFGVSVMKNNFIYRVTEEVMSDLVVGGIPQNLLNYIETVVFRPSAPEPKDLKKFEIKDLEFGFVIYLQCCAASIIVFLIEICVFYLKKICGLRGVLRYLNDSYRV